MASYQPQFAITNHMVKLVSEIAEKIGRLDRYQSLDAKPCLRRNNRIRSIHSSLAIEANSLSIDAVRGVIDGKTVVGPVKEIQEVKNAYRAYDELGKFDPFSIDEPKRLHGVMTYLTVDESGQFRRGEEGVFDGGRCIFMAPPAMHVSALMDDLFSWMKQARKDVHPLILSSVFHYEFVFIHPFADGNGRMARLWQTSLLCEWNRVFQYMPIESRIHAFQSEYYEAISKCHNEGSANSFIDSCWRRSVKHWICIYSNQAQQTHRSANMSGDCSMLWNPALYPKPQKLSVRILKRSLSDERSQRL